MKANTIFITEMQDAVEVHLTFNGKDFALSFPINDNQNRIECKWLAQMCGQKTLNALTKLGIQAYDDAIRNDEYSILEPRIINYFPVVWTGKR